MAKLNGNGKGVLRASLPKVHTDQLGWNKDTIVKYEIKGNKIIISEVSNAK